MNTSNLRNRIIHGNCIDVLRDMPSVSVDLIVTDPPYLVRYKDRNGRTIRNDDAPEQVLGAFADLYRVLKPNSICISFYGWNAIDQFFHAWKGAGFKPVAHMVWNKSYASRRGFVNAHHEQAYVLVKGRPEKPTTPINDVLPWEYSGNRIHPTEKAVSVLMPLVESFSRPGAVVLDPFSGSGSTAVAAVLSGRDAIGIELEQRYAELGQRRLDGALRYRACRNERTAA